MPWDKMRTAKWAVISIAITLGGTLLLWHLFGVAGLFGFLFLPFFGFGGTFGGRRGNGPDESDPGPRIKTCPRCGHQSTDPADGYCPRDGSPLL